MDTAQDYRWPPRLAVRRFRPRGDERLAAIYTQINAAKLNGIDPQA